MMPKSTNSQEIDISQIATYQSGIAQASAHRAINRLVSDYLLMHGLTAMQWFALGTIYDAGDQGIRLSDLTRKLSTTLPYITNMVALLESKGMVRKVAHAGDSRIKLVSVTPNYKKTVDSIERGLRDHMRVNLYQNDGISREELQSYISVLYKIVQRGNV
jgi:DNA-binding MarR family transcriptional regulator